MWSRKELKTKAKEVLRRGYLSAFGVSIVIAIASGAYGGGGGGRARGHREYTYPEFDFHNFINWKIVLFVLSIFALFLALRIFLGYILEVGGRRYFIKSAQNTDNKKCLRFGFQNGNYSGIIKTMFVKNFFIFLWTLLLIIPGIIKSYAYSMVPYILADNPNIGVRKAIDLSEEITRGHKWDMFVLDLSFIGWYLLGALLLGVGVFFVMPYDNATKAELYLVLRNNALNDNLCSVDDLLLNEINSYDNNGMW